MVERTLPKPDTRVRFPSAALQSLLLHSKRLFAAEAGIASRRKYIPSRARDFRLPARQPLHKPRTLWFGALFFRLDAVVGLGWTGRGGMFLAPAVGAKEVYSVRMGLQQTLSR